MSLVNLFRLSLTNVSSFVGKIAYLHNKKFSSSSAFEIEERGAVILSAPRILAVSSAKMHIYNESLTKKVAEIGATWHDFEKNFDNFKFSLNIPKLGTGLYFFKIEIYTIYGLIYAVGSNEKLYFSYDINAATGFQLSISNFKYNYNNTYAGGVIYHIFVDRFNRGGNVPLKDGALLVKDWSHGVPEFPAYPGAPMKNNTFYGGTLYGVIDKLDYIASLGANLIYLSPIFDASSNHKYDTGDYMSVDSMFGGEVALKKLIAEAKKRGIGIILDGVFNHTGDDSLYFNRYERYDSIGAYQSKKSPYYDWYAFQDYPREYTCWWGIEILPRINPTTESCKDFFVGDSGVIEKYAKMGIAGMRLDVVDELPDSFVADIKQKLNEYNDASILYGEVWEDASNKIAYDTRKKYYLGEELDGVMNYPVREGIIDYILNKNTHKLKYALTTILYNAPTRIRNMQMNLLGTHDTMRILTVLGGESSNTNKNSELREKRLPEEKRKLAILRLKSAYTILATIPGIPSVFYGDEAGLEGYSDPFNRMPYPWGKEEHELLEHYKLIGNLRRTNSVYKEGDFSLLHLDEDMLIFSRNDYSCSYVTIFNNSNKRLNIEFSAHAKPLLFDNNFEIQPLEARVFKVSLKSTLFIIKT